MPTLAALQPPVDRVSCLADETFFAEILLLQTPDGRWHDGVSLGHSIDEGLKRERLPVAFDAGHATRQEAIDSVFAKILAGYENFAAKDQRFAGAVEKLKTWKAGSVEQPEADAPAEEEEAPPFDALPSWAQAGVFARCWSVDVPLRKSLGTKLTACFGERLIDGRIAWAVQQESVMTADLNAAASLSADSPHAENEAAAMAGFLDRATEIWADRDARAVVDLGKFRATLEAKAASCSDIDAGRTKPIEQAAAEAALPPPPVDEPVNTDATPENMNTAALETGNAGAAPEPKPSRREQYELDLQQAERDVVAMALAMSEASVECKAAKESLSDAEEAFQAAVEMLATLKHRGPPSENDSAPSGGSTITLTLGGESARVNVSAEPAETNEWRGVPLSQVGLSAGLVAILAENPSKSLGTIGDLADWSSSGRPLTEISKVGPAKAEAIEKAMEDFWRKNPQYAR